MELLLGDLLVRIVDRQAIELVDVLEAVHDEALEGARVQHFVVVNEQLVKGLDALDLAEQNERIQVVVRQHQLLQLLYRQDLIELFVALFACRRVQGQDGVLAVWQGRVKKTMSRLLLLIIGTIASDVLTWPQAPLSLFRIIAYWMGHWVWQLMRAPGRSLWLHTGRDALLM